MKGFKFELYRNLSLCESLLESNKAVLFSRTFRVVQDCLAYKQKMRHENVLLTVDDIVFIAASYLYRTNTREAFNTALLTWVNNVEGLDKAEVSSFANNYYINENGETQLDEYKECLDYYIWFILKDKGIKLIEEKKKNDEMNAMIYVISRFVEYHYVVLKDPIYVNMMKMALVDEYDTDDFFYALNHLQKNGFIYIEMDESCTLIKRLPADM